MFTFGDALHGAPREYVDESQPHMPKRVVRLRRTADSDEAARL